MTLARNVHEVLQGIVGAENISEEPVILDTYCFQWLAETVTGSKFFTRPEAVLLPGSTDEVQAVVKACNRFGVKYKALSTGWGPWNAPGSDGVILLDLRRMDRILDIDEKNMYAVVEPYVIFTQLQVEAMKRGLTCHIVGAGANTSPLASCTSMSGMGLSGISMSYNARNPLAVEWVLPNGDVLRLGSLGSGCGWFCGDGPGPSLRGVMRGTHGAMGGLGVFTKCAVKLYPWPGPRQMRFEGVSPAHAALIPENFRCYVLCFPTWESFTDAAYKIAEAEIGYAMGKQIAAGIVPLMAASSSTEYASIRQSGMADEAMKEFRHSFQLILGANSLREVEYQERALREILTETGGWIPAITQDPERQKATFRMMIKVDGNSAIFRLSGSFGTSFGAETSCDAAMVHARLGEEIKKKYIERGVIADDGAEWAWGAEMNEGGRFAHVEELFMYDPADPESAKGAAEFIEETSLLTAKQAPGLAIWELARGGLGPEAHDVYGPACSNYHVWQRRIKKAFDPNTASDPSFYIEP